MMKQKIEHLLRGALKQYTTAHGLTLPSAPHISVERPKDAGHGDFSSNIAMVLAKSFKMAPALLAEQLIAYIEPDKDIKHMACINGFINFTLSDQCLMERLSVLCASPSCGIEAVSSPKTVVVDYSSPNLAKEMHVGHLRSTIIGDALARIFEKKGHHVVRQNHVGDWGTQFGMLIAHLDDEVQEHPGALQLNDLEKFYKEAKTRFDADADFADRARQWVVKLQSGEARSLSLWQLFIDTSMAHSQEIYKRLEVDLKPSDVRAESAYNEQLPKVVDSLKNQALLEENDGALCVFLDAFKGKDNQPLPIIIQKKDGGYLYATTDLAAIDYRHKVLKADRVLYVVDTRQSLHFQQIFALAYRAGFAPDTLQLEHVHFGMVLDKSGKPFKSREGGVTKLADLLDEAVLRARRLIQIKNPSIKDNELDCMAQVLGIAAIKYADLSKNRISDYVFDWDAMLSFEGNTAPYLLYAYTRINSLLRKADHSIPVNISFVLCAPLEIELAKKLILFPEIIDQIILKATPHLLCHYLFELAGIFSAFYEACPILNQDDEAVKISRLQLAQLTSRILKSGLSLLGIRVLTKM